MRSNCKHVAAVLIEAERRSSPPCVATAVPSLPTASGPSGSLGRSLSPPLQLWLGELDEACAANPAANDYPPEIKQRLLYVLNLEPGTNGFPLRASLTPMMASLLQSGKFGSGKSVAQANSTTTNQPSICRPHRPRDPGRTRLVAAAHPWCRAGQPASHRQPDGRADAVQDPEHGALPVARGQWPRIERRARAPRHAPLAASRPAPASAW